MGKNQQPPDQPLVYQLKVTLEGIKPPIWRRIQVPADVPLDVLHVILQLAMGWENTHLHHFKVGKQFYAPTDEGDFDMPGTEDEGEFALNEVASAEKAKLTYEYDFGDNWEHTIIVEKILPADPKIEYPICIDGARACPMEDSGGVWGYQEKLDILADPKHPEYEDVADWMGGEDYDPEEFSVEDTNGALSELDEILDEIAMFDDISPEDIMSMLRDGIATLKSGITQVRRLSNGVVLDLTYHPDIMGAAFQFMMFHHPSVQEAKFGIEMGPNDALRLQITGPKEIMAQLEQILGISQ